MAQSSRLFNGPDGCKSRVIVGNTGAGFRIARQRKREVVSNGWADYSPCAAKRKGFWQVGTV